MYLSPVEGEAGVELGFNYWIQQQTKVHAAPPSATPPLPI